VEVEHKKEFSQETLKTVHRLCKLGFTRKRLAEFFEVREATITDWRKNFPAFDQAMKEGGELADANVAEKTYQNAIGYQMEVTEPFKTKAGVEMVTYIKKFKPDVTAQKFWLASRQRELWGEKSESTQNINVINKKVEDINMEGFTEREKKLLNQTLQQTLNR
jgi:hypothetical protein